ncbi:hypothetical protein ACH5RR_012461 [Cinchona calisaya]|uniref:SAP domain-containing protein n=1 Tax=Cinchona calisaya TaxID=153742 RepID=A0ABD3ABF3_9GENT
MSSPYPVLGNRPIDQWKVTELKEELKRRKLATKGLKDDLVRRLDEALRSEQEIDDLNKDDFDSVIQSDAFDEQERTEVYTSEKAQDTISIRNNTTSETNEDTQLKVTYEQESNYSFLSERAKDTINRGDPTSQKVDGNMLNVDINDTQGLIGEEKVREWEGVAGSDSAGLEGKQVAEITAKETCDLVTENPEPVITSSGEDLQKNVTQNESRDLNAQLETDDLKSVHVDAKDNKLDTNNQVSEVNPVLGFQVKSDSISTESDSINEKNELKDNIIADDVKLELDVKPEMMEPSSSSVVPEGGKSHPMDVEEPHANKVSVEETGGNNAQNMDVVQKNETGDLGSSEKLNLDRSSGNDFMEEDVIEGKQMDLKADSDEMGVEAGKVEAPTVNDGGVVDNVGEDLPPESKIAYVDDKNVLAAPSTKRKLNDRPTVGNNDVAKRQRRWNSAGLKVPEPQSVDVVSTTPKNVFQPAFKRSFSRSDSTVSEEVPKERVVPPSPKPATNSLRIDRFLRPFTLKAVQDLLGKTGTVINFWMDNIKTHCYVSYSSVEEAVETRNAVYNLQWPPNGGRLLVAEFVDPQEVKVRVEAPQSPATPVSTGASITPVSQNVLSQPSPRQQVQKQQFQQPPLPPPPALSNPPLAREHVPPPTREHLPPVRERLTLPPPPPLPEKAADPPIVTLDDLFRKTKATPRIYYLPLSEEQVAAKLQAQGKAVKQ